MTKPSGREEHPLHRRNDFAMPCARFEYATKKSQSSKIQLSIISVKRFCLQVTPRPITTTVVGNKRCMNKRCIRVKAPQSPSRRGGTRASHSSCAKQTSHVWTSGCDCQSFQQGRYGTHNKPPFFLLSCPPSAPSKVPHIMLRSVVPTIRVFPLLLRYSFTARRMGRDLISRVI